MHFSFMLLLIEAEYWPWALQS